MTSRNEVATSLLKRTQERQQQRSILAKAWLKLQSRLNREKSNLSIIRNSLFFDGTWYLRTYPDVAEHNVDPAEHYLKFGAIEGRDPGPFFSTLHYIRACVDVAERNINPLLHLETRGCVQGRGVVPSTEKGKGRGTTPAERVTAEDRAAILAHMTSLGETPLFSVILLPSVGGGRFLREAVSSLLLQLYENWELCVCVDPTLDWQLRALLSGFADDPRFKISLQSRGQASTTQTNASLALASGAFVALMGQDDLLHETALYEMAVAINSQPDADILYSDEDRLDPSGRHGTAYFKTDFDPDLLSCQDMINGLGVYRRSLIERIGGFREALGDSQAYDLSLRAWCASSRERICHIPELLYHRRDLDLPASAEANARRRMETDRRAIQNSLDAEGEGATAIPHPLNPAWSRILRQVPEPAPRVSIIVLTKDRADLLSVCADGVLNKTDYPNFELIIVDHASEEAATHLLLEQLRRDPRVRIMPYSGTFNFSAMNNVAARACDGSLIALLNNDIEMMRPDWLTEMVALAVRADVGAVGAKLYYPDGTIQHAGVIAGLGGAAGHAFAFLPGDTLGDAGRAVLTRTVSAVTAACLVVRRSVFFEVGGLNESTLAVAFNDIDLCFKIQVKGYRNVWTPFAELIHHQSASRGDEDTPVKKERFAREEIFMMSHWAGLIANDPYYNPNLSLVTSTYARVPTRRAEPWSDFM